VFVPVFSEKIPASRTPKRTEAKRRERADLFFSIAKLRECWKRALKEKKKTKDLAVDSIGDLCKLDDVAEADH
jgi:hypothetical protein